MISICVPLRRDGAERDRNWEFLRARYERLHPGWEIVEADRGGTWCKGAAVNEAVERSSGDILVIADADVMVSARSLRFAAGILDTFAWVTPYEQVWRMNEETTQRLFDGGMGDEPVPLGPTQIASFPLPGTIGGGIFVMQRKDWIPMDERFLDWGGEDISHGRVLRTLVGKCRLLPSVLWHLWHEPMPHREGRRCFRQESEDLANRYHVATTSKEEMEALVNEPYVAALS